MERKDKSLAIVPFGADRFIEYCGERRPIQGWYCPEFGVKQRNVVWGLQYTGSLPAWQGYFLIPNGENIEAPVFRSAGNWCRLQISIRDNTYHLASNGSSIEMERE